MGQNSVRSVSALAFVCALCALPPAARADRAVGKFMLHGVGMVTRHEGASFSPSIGQSEPDMVNDMHLDEDGLLLGGGLMGSLMADGTRLAFGLSFFGVRDTSMVHSPLAAGFELEEGTLWGESLELRLGREFMVGPLFPYIDLRLSLLIQALQTTMVSDEHGVLGNTQYTRVAVGIGPVAGLFVPMDDLFVDLSGYAGLFGDEKVGGMLGAGVWMDL